MTWLEAAVRWYLVLIAISWAFAPAVGWLLDGLADRGVSLVRPVALLAAVYPAWLLSSLHATPFDERALAVAIVFGGGIAWAFAIRRRPRQVGWLRSLLLVEAASLCLFLMYLWLHGFTPQIMGTEKPMDVAFLASSARSTAMPPADPWFVGEPINYYYLGYLLFGSIARLAGVTPELAFNLALATIFSTTVVAAFGVGWNALRRTAGAAAATAAGLLAAFGLAIAGNLYAPWRLVQDAPATIDAFWWDSAAGIGWRSSRIVCDGPRVGNVCPPPATETINEFPFFSFLLGDLHPHLMALPFTLVALSMAWNIAARSQISGDSTVFPQAARIAFSGGIVGALVALNAWDFPTFLILSLLALWAGYGRNWRAALAPVTLFVTAAVVAWLPFFTAYTPPTMQSIDPAPPAIPVLSGLLSTIGLHIGERTSVVEYLTMFGAPYLFALLFLAAGLSSADHASRQRLLRTLGIAAVASVIPGVLLAAPVIPLCGLPLAVALAELKGGRSCSPRTLALVLFAMAWALSIGVEIVFIRDAFDDRMNTLFKFYYQTWTLYALGAAVAVTLLWLGASAWRWARPALAVAVGLALVAGAAYPAVASYQWTQHFAYWRGLDGLAYGEAASPDDVSAIRWLAQNAAPGDVVLEAAGCAYLPFDWLPFSRVSAFTGVPTIIGWGDNHQRQWRAGQPDLLARIDQRERDVATMYADPQSPLFDRYGVDWLFVGDYELGDWQSECTVAGPYPGVSSPDFPGPVWEEAFRSGATRVYRRAP